MIRVKNQKMIRKLSWKSMQANRVRNAAAIAAIALTTMLFMALFTITGTMVDTFQQQTFRLVGTASHGFFKNLTTEQKELLEHDPMIRESGGRLFLGAGSGEKFRKTHAELSYMEPGYRKRSFCEPKQGNIPKEGTKEIACDTRILNCLGVSPGIGAEITLTYTMGGLQKTEITDHFILSGWWEYDPAAPANMALLPESYVREMIREHPRHIDDSIDMTGLWTLDIMLRSSLHINEDMNAILHHYGYQSQDETKDNYIGVGVNWGYAGAQLAVCTEPQLTAAVGMMLFLILLTGYLIIYNIFQISVNGDIRFYGLLKTIGTTGKQIRRIIRRQAFALAAAGIPIGLFAGSLAGVVLTPIILSVLNVKCAKLKMRFWFFLVAAVFSLLTVWLSCAKPGRMAAKVAPAEAVRYTDTAVRTCKRKKGRTKGKPLRMACAGLGRSRKKTALVVASMTLAVVLFQITYTIAAGFDMDKYLRSKAICDFILGDSSYFQVNKDQTNAELPSVSEEDISRLKKGGQITEGGRIYGHRLNISVYTPIEDYKNQQQYLFHHSKDQIREQLADARKDTHGNPASEAYVYGMEEYPLSQLQVLDGDLADLYDPDQHTVAAVYMVDDDQKIEYSQWAKAGDTITMHYVYEWEYYDDATGALISQEEAYRNKRPVHVREKESADMEYRVAACVAIRNVMSYRSYGGYEYVMHARNFIKDSRTRDVMTYLFNTADDSSASMQAYLEDYTNRVNPDLDFESRQTYVQAFVKYRKMFLLMGGMLSGVTGLVGILNFFNAALTSMVSRRHEFALLQSVGMTGRQLTQMLICEGLLYGAVTVLVSFGCGLLMTPVAESVIGSVFWFVTYRYTIWPLLIVLPVFAALGIVLPLVCYHKAVRQSIVERLRESSG